MKRPLFAAAVCLILLFSLFNLIFPDSKDKTMLSLISENGNAIKMSGTVSSIDSKYIYINRISFAPSRATSSCAATSCAATSCAATSCAASSCATSSCATSSCAASSAVNKDTDYIDLPVKIKIVLSSDDFSEYLTIGNRITVYGKFRTFSSASNPGEFDAASYYESLRVYGKITPDSLYVTDDGIKYPAALFYRLRTFLSKRIDSVYPSKEASIIKDLLLGDKADLDPDIKALYQRNGIAHILSVSSLHISLLGYGLYKLLKKLGTGNYFPIFASTAVLFCYGMLTGFGTSAVRAITVFIIAMSAKIIGRTSDSLTSLAAAAIILLIANSGCIQSCGFLLSFGSALGIYSVYPALNDIFFSKESALRRYEEDNIGNRIKKIFYKAFHSLGNTMLTSLSITLTTLPVQLCFFYEIPTYSVLINPLVLPFLSLLMISSILSFFPPLQLPASFISCIILKWYELLCRLFDKFPLSTWNPGHPPVAVIIVYYACLISFLIFHTFLKKSAKTGSFFFKFEKIAQNKHFVRIFFLITYVILLIIIGLPKLIPGTAIFMDVGQGDCILVYTGGRDVYLFDGGSTSRTDVGKYVIKPVLKYYGLSTIDAVFISHTDSDHYNGIVQLLENSGDWNITVKRLYFPDMKNITLESGYSALINSAVGNNGGNKNSDMFIGYIHEGDTWNSGSTFFTCLHPPSGYGSEDINAASACFHVSFGKGNSSLLLCGDVTGEGEEMLAGQLENYPPVTVLKVAHHGSKYSTSDDFLDRVRCSAAVISVGAGNLYGHPHKETLERLSNHNCIIYATSEKGAVKIHFSARSQQAKITCFLNSD